MAQTDFFLKIAEAPGESTDSKHKDEIDVMSWSWGESNSGTMGAGTGGGAGKVAMSDFSFVMRTNKASAKLILMCATGAHIKEATLTCRKAGGEQVEYLKVILEDCLVSSYNTGGSGGEVVPVDQVSLNFAKIRYEYSPQDAKGGLMAPVKVGYDVAANQKL